MKALRPICIFIFLFSNFLAVGQMISVKEKNSFYLGQRFTAGFLLNAGVDIEPMFNAEGKEGFLFLNVQPQIELMAALTNKWSVKGVARYHSITSRMLDPNGYLDFINLYGNYYYLDGYTKFNGVSTGLYIMNHRERRGAIAPIGNQMGLGFIRSSFQANTDNVVLINDDTRVQSNLPDFTYKMNFYTLSGTYVLRQMLSKKVYYDLGGTLNLNFAFDKPDAPSILERQIVDEIFYNGTESLALHQAFTINFGAGIVF